WLLGVLRAARNDTAGALASFDRELEQTDQRRLYRTEYAVNALLARGHITLQSGQLEDSARAFASALEFVPGHARSLLGLAVARKRLGKPDAAKRLEEARKAVAALHTPDREI